MRNSIRGIAGVMVIALASICLAEQIKIGFAGSVNGINDPYNLLENGVQQGAPISGFYIYDSATLDSEPSIYDGLYKYTTEPYGMSLTVGNLTFQTDPTNVDFVIGIENNYYGELYDYYGVTSHNNLQLNNGLLIDRLHWQLDDYSGTAISSDALPSTAPDLSKWQSNSLSVLGGSDEKTQFIIRGQITSVYLIPEPASLLLLGLGSLLLRKRK